MESYEERFQSYRYTPRQLLGAECTLCGKYVTAQHGILIHRCPRPCEHCGETLYTYTEECEHAQLCNGRAPMAEIPDPLTDDAIRELCIITTRDEAGLDLIDYYPELHPE